MIRLKFLKQHKNDLLLIVAVLLLAGVFWLCRAATRQTGAAVEVSVDGRLYETLPLHKDARLVIADGEHSNTLVIEKGKAFMSAASCPDHVCMDRGAVQYDGETIVCLPNKVVVTVLGGEDSGFDAVSG